MGTTCRGGIGASSDFQPPPATVAPSMVAIRSAARTHPLDAVPEDVLIDIFQRLSYGDLASFAATASGSRQTVRTLASASPLLCRARCNSPDQE